MTAYGMGAIQLRIAFGGIAHETNTFSTLRTTLSHFNVRQGEELLERADQREFWAAFRQEDVVPIPTLIASAPPYGLVKHDVYQQLKQELLARLEASLPVDGVYLPIHGAMEVEQIGDGESDLTLAIRQTVGPNVPIFGALDLHGNIAPAVIEHTDLLTALRTAPHRDSRATGMRAVQKLIQTLRKHLHPAQAMVKVPLLLPGECAVTEVEPARSLYARLSEIEAAPGILDASLFIGCAWTDSPYTSVSAVAVAEEDVSLARQHAARLAAEVWEKRESFGPDVETASVDEAIALAAESKERPVFVSDSGDNITAGGAGDVPLLAERLMAAKRPRALVAGIADAAAVQACVQAGIGKSVTLSIGGKLDRVNSRPLRVTGEVISLTPESAPTNALLRAGHVDVVLSSGRREFTSFKRFYEVGTNPDDYDEVVVKLGYLFPELRDRAKRAIMALSPGFTDLRIEALPYHHVMRPIFPLDRDMTWEPTDV